MHTLHYFVQKQNYHTRVIKNKTKKEGETIMLPLASAPDILLNIKKRV